MALKHMAGAARGGFRNAIENIEHYLIGMVLIAAVVVAASHGWHKGSSASYLWGGVLAMALVAVVGMEFRGAKRMMTAWYERQAGAMLGWGCLWAICAAGTLWTSYGTAAVNTNKIASGQKAAFVAYDDVSKSKTELETAITRYEKELASLPNARPEAAVLAEIAKLEKTKAFENSKACAEANTKDRRSVCQAIDNLNTEKSVSGRRIVIEDKIAGLKGELRSTRAKAETTEVVLSEDSPTIQAIVDWTGVKQETARRMEAMQFSVIIQALLTLGALLMIVEQYRGVPRKPWINWARIWGGDDTAPQAPATDAARAEPMTALPGPSTSFSATIVDNTVGNEIINKLKAIADRSPAAKAA